MIRISEEHKRKLNSVLDQYPPDSVADFLSAYYLEDAGLRATETLAAGERGDDAAEALIRSSEMSLTISHFYLEVVKMIGVLAGKFKMNLATPKVYNPPTVHVLPPGIDPNRN